MSDPGSGQKLSEKALAAIELLRAVPLIALLAAVTQKSKGAKATMPPPVEKCTILNKVVNVSGADDDYFIDIIDTASNVYLQTKYAGVTMNKPVFRSKTNEFVPWLQELTQPAMIAGAGSSARTRTATSSNPEGEKAAGRKRSRASAPHAGRPTGVAPCGLLHAGRPTGVADRFFLYTDVRSILMILLAFSRGSSPRTE